MASKNSEQPTPQPDNQAIMLTKETLVELVREMRRPDPEHEEKLRLEADLKKKRMLRKIRIVKAEEEAKRQREARCGHRKPNGEPSTGYANYSNGRVQEMCLRCQKIIREFWQPEVAQGMALQKKLEKLGVSREELDNIDLSPDDLAVGVGAELTREPWAADLTTEHH